MYKINPYNPGAGIKPAYLAGRDEIIEDLDNIFEAIKMNYIPQSVIFSGLRGVGKTVLINVLQDKAEEKGIFCRHIEVENRNDFISQIAACMQLYLRKHNTKESLKYLIEKGIDAIKSLVISFDPTNATFSVSANEKALYEGLNLAQSLTDLFLSVGSLASKVENPICIFIDEIQYLKQNELGALISAIHRSNQMGYPVMIVGAGLPKIYKMLSEEKSYSERLFKYIEIGSLNFEDSKKAIEEPLAKLKVSYSTAATKLIYSITHGYPYFIQQFCKIIYSGVDDKLIDLDDVKKSEDSFFKEIDSGFFKTRYERCSETEKVFAFAMTACETLPCTIKNIAYNLEKSVNSISPTRAQLISKGIIYPTSHGELDFTVPEFDGFIRRHKDYNDWKKNRALES